LGQLISVLRAAGEPNRLRILALCANGDLTVSELTRILGQSQPGVSRHLRLLCDAGLLERYQEGSWAYFHLPTKGEAARIARFLVAQIGDDDSLVSRDRLRLAEIQKARATLSDQYFRENAARWDHIRTLHVDETEVEQALLGMLGGKSFESLLDIGTGTGRMLQVLAGVAGESIGVDQSRDMLSVARTNLSDRAFQTCSVRQADMYDLPFAEKSFDLVVLHMVLHFAEHPHEVVREAARVLCPGGQFLVVDFARHDMEALRDEHAHRRLGFRTADIDDWAAEAGLDSVEVRNLPGKQLTVRIWLLSRPAEIHALEPAATRQGSL
jgi:ubiquinone/menaquinone biosynthesis C-methylase UbiE